jgi:hypothetical protein
MIPIQMKTFYHTQLHELQIPFMDAICFMTPFPLMNWSWTSTSSEPIHFYHSKLCEENAKDFFYEICHSIVVAIHTVIYGHPPPKIYENIMGNLGTLADFFIKENLSTLEYLVVLFLLLPFHNFYPTGQYAERWHTK